MKNIYNREEYISTYHLDIDEITLLPLDMRLGYIEHLFRNIVNRVVELQEEKFFRGYLHPVFNTYFDKCGCRVINYDFGIEEYGIKSIRKSDFTVDPKYVSMALDYTKEVAKIRSEVFENIYEGVLNHTKESLEGGVLEGTPDLTGLDNILNSTLSSGLIGNEVCEEIAKREINALGIKHKETVSMSNFLPVVYRNVLSKEGYELTKEVDELKVRRLK